MPNQFWGAAVVLVSIALFYWAYKESKSGKIEYALLIIMLAGLVLRVYASMDFYLHEWDERYHALVAKNMMEHPMKPLLYENPLLPYDFRLWGSNHVWLHKQPFPLWIMAGSMSIFGINEISVRLPSILLSTAAIFFTFYIGSYYFGKRVGLLAAFFHSINGLLIEITAGRTTTDHPDIFFTCLIELSVFLSIVGLKRDKLLFYFFAGISLGLAILTKWLPALITLPIWLTLALNNKDYGTKKILVQFAIILVTAFLVATPWHIYIHAAFPEEAKWESHYNWLHITQALEGHEGTFFYHFDKMRIIWGELIYLPIGWFLYQTFRHRDFKHLSLLIWIFVPVLFFSFVATKMQAYTLIDAPAIFIILAWHCSSLMQKPLYFRQKIISRIILLLLIFLPIRYCIERLKPFQNHNRRPVWVSNFKNLEHQYREKKVVLFNETKPIEAMFYTNFIAYPNIPDSEKIEELKSEGYLILVRNSKEAKDKYSQNQSVILVD